MTGSGTADALILAAAVTGAVSALWRFLHLGELIRGTRAFLLDWLGEPARPGRDAVEPFPARFAKVERHTHELKGALPQLAVGFDELLAAVDRVDARVTDHRNRNAEQVQLLREYVERELRHLQANSLRAEVYRAALVELGLDVDPPNPTHPRPETMTDD